MIDVYMLENRDGKYAKKAEKIIDEVLREQTLDVDVITGATRTSKAILKEIERALKKKG